VNKVEGTKAFLESVETFSQNVPDDQVAAYRTQVVDYCMEQDKMDAPVELTDLYGHLAPHAVSGINLGLFCSTPAVALSRNLSRKHAFEMLFTGKFIDSATAVEWGLINRAVPADELDAAVKELTDSICAKSRVPVQIGKEMFYEQLGMELSDAYEFAGEKMACNMMSEDAAEGIDAFLERRKPTWKGC